MMILLELQNIEKCYDQLTILHDVCFSLRDGDLLVLTGPIGCGKRTLINVIAGQEESTGGFLKLNGSDITQAPPESRYISSLFQSSALLPNMTVAENIECSLNMRNIEKLKKHERIQTITELMEIEHLLGHKPDQLSRLDSLKVAISCALALETKLYLFDEPLSRLDKQFRQNMREEIKKLHKKLKLTIIYLTHDHIEAMTLATRIAVMKGGVLQQIGTPQEVYKYPANTFVAGFMNSPRMNFFKTQVIETGGAIAIKFRTIDAQKIIWKLPKIFNHLEQYKGHDVITGILPEIIDLSGENCEHNEFFQIFAAKIETIEISGQRTYVNMNFYGKEIYARLERDQQLKEGQEKLFIVNLAELVFFDESSKLLINPLLTPPYSREPEV
jgi:multiple sugar transport system ATP-binding protein